MCERLVMPNGAVGFICRGHRRRPPLCSICGRRPSTRLCDYPITPRRTCSKPLCNVCKISPGDAAELDYCPTHEAVPIVDLFEGLS